MAAKVYAPPEELGKYSPDYNASTEEWLRYDDEYIERVQEWCRSYSGAELAGEVVRWHRGDGYAQYVVWKLRPLSLIHLPVGDAWQMDQIFLRGLTAADIREQVGRQQRLAEIFGGVPAINPFEGGAA